MMTKDDILKMFPIKEKILFISQVGSFLYGTNSEKSDTDIKGVFLPDLDELILNKAPKHYNFKTGNNFERNTKDDIDVTFYSLQYFLDLASKGETNVLDMLFAYTNENAIIFKDELWNVLIKNVDKVVTRNVNSYLGYCKSQCIKYSVKGDKLNNYRVFESFCKEYYEEKNENGAPITLNTALKNFANLNENELPKVGDDRKVFSSCATNTTISFGEHTYFVTADNKEVYLQISGVKFQLQDSIKSSYHKVSKVIGSYGQRAENAASDNGADFKAISHAVRVLFQTEELLTTGMIKFPLKQGEFVKSIKYKQTDMKYDDIIDFITKKIDYIDSDILPNCKIREKSDFKWIENYILSCYNI